MTATRDPEGTEKKILAGFADFNDRRVLEVGCGEGRLTWKYASAPVLTIGLDPDRTALKVARTDCPGALRQSVQMICASAGNTPLTNETFDIAILAWSL